MSPSRLLLRAAVLAALVPLAACDPCFGVSVCGEPRVDVYGNVLLHLNRTAARDVGVVFVRTGGVQIEPDSQLVRSDSTGRFHLEARADDEGIVEGRLLFLPPAPFAALAYEVPVRIGTIRSRGDTRFLGEWGVGPVPVSPHFNYGGEVRFRGDGGPMAGVQVVFQRSAGVEIPGGTISATTGTDGYFYLRAEAAGEGEVVGSLRITPPAPWEAFTVPNVRMTTRIVRAAPDRLGGWNAGGKVHYQGELNWADTYTFAPGIEVEFRRTGGVAVEPETFVARTGTDGRFHLRPVVRDTGVVIADLYVRAPRNPFVIPGVRMRVYQSDDPPLLGVWTVNRP